MRIAVASDHAGLPLKRPIMEWLQGAGHEAVDYGTNSDEPVDYPDVISPAARAVADGECELGIVLGGSGTGEQIVSNKIRGIRCVEATEPVTALLGREHNDANVLAMGARIIGQEVALACVAAFVAGEFAGGRHARRVDKIAQLEAAFGNERDHRDG
ncbi:MAG: RpiB/LacA/LacB family sugar-phosphate isomerase [Chloroflexota bacterium]|nr:RpiB/LacA/LacB family sugar-phosphate isomerase [Chloroflexota bacterium]